MARAGGYRSAAELHAAELVKRSPWRPDRERMPNHSPRKTMRRAILPSRLAAIAAGICVLLTAIHCPAQQERNADGRYSAESTGDGETKRIYSITIHDLPAPASSEYPTFQAWFKNHPRVRPGRMSQLKIQTLERGSLMMAIAGGIAPDLLRVYHHEARAWIRNGFFEPLDRYIYKDTDGNGRYTHGVDEVIWKPFLNIPEQVRNFMIDDGHIYILPRFQWIQYFVYRKDLFVEAGLDPEKRLETFDDLLYACRKITEPHLQIPGARSTKGRRGIGITPNGWIWQGYLYAYGGASMFTEKTCPECGTTTEFRQGEFRWKCPACGHDLKEVSGRERAAIDSPEAREALLLWQKLLWAPFCKCPTCREPIELGGPQDEPALPLDLTCPACSRPFVLDDPADVIHGCARACIDTDSRWTDLWFNGEIAIANTYLTDWIIDSNVDPAVVGVMPFPEKGGASAYHYYGIYAGTRDRDGGQDRVDVCANMILDFVSQFYVPTDSPDYMKYNREKARYFVNSGFYNLCRYDELVAAGLEEYANEIPVTSRHMQRLIWDPDYYTFLPISEGYNRIQQEVLGHVLLSRICTDRNYNIEENLKKAEALANTQVFMKDEIVQEMKRRYRLPFVAALVLFVAFVAFCIYKVVVKNKDRFGIVRERRVSFGKRAASIALLLPAVGLVLLWAYYPLVRGSIMAFQDVKVMGASRFVGIENFIRVVTNPMFPGVIKATLIFVFAVLSLGFMAPVILAILLSEARRGSTAYRAIYYAPHLLGGVVVLFIWKIFYMPTTDGMLNQVLDMLGIDTVLRWLGIAYPVRWLENPLINKWMLVIPTIWAGTGSACLVYLAALKGVDDEMYEAAEIDGASTWQKIMRITLPSLKPLLIINFVGAFIGAFHGMGNILVLTGGAFGTNVIGLQIFMEAFGYLRFGSSTALAWILGSMLIGFTIYQLNFLKKVEFRRAQ
jgi:ABC-type sugar transport system permease subunit/ribosomal protein S27E